MADQEIVINNLAVIQELNDTLARSTDLHEGYELVASYLRSTGLDENDDRVFWLENASRVNQFIHGDDIPRDQDASAMYIYAAATLSHAWNGTTG